MQQYKYLGLVINEFLDYKVTAEMVAKSASRALGVLIAKSKAHGGMPYEVFTKLFNSVVQPVIDYGASIWGTRDFACINSVQHKACRFFLGVGKYTPNIASEGELGWPFPQQRTWSGVTKMWCRLMSMENGRLNKRIFTWAKQANVKNWAHRVAVFYSKLNMTDLLDEDYVFENPAIIDNVNTVLFDYYEAMWWAGLNRESAVRGGGRNKLRTYRKFKAEYKDFIVTEKIQYKYRSAFSKFKCGVAPIRIETGRYEQLPEGERLCQCCDEAVIESEMHVIMSCPFYSDIRQVLLSHASNVDDSFIQYDKERKFITLFTCKDMIFNTAKACYDILHKRRCFLYTV